MLSPSSHLAVVLTLISQLSAGTSLVAKTPTSTQHPGQQQSQKQKIDQIERAAKVVPPPAKPDVPSSGKPGFIKPLSTNENPDLIGRRNINKGIIARMSGSAEKDVAMGRQMAAEIDRQVEFIEDPVITEYINRVGQNVVLHSDAKVPFTIKVIDSDEVNAFALPGGFLYINKGLILAADNEAEVAGVMAHEIAHVAARHTAKNQTKGHMMQAGVIVGSIFLGGVPGLIFRNIANFVMLPVSLKFSRSAEGEADRLGVQYLYAAGYDPGAMATMFEKVLEKDEKKPGLISRAFSTHPATKRRLAASRALVARFPGHEEYVLSTSEFQRVKAKLLRLSNVHYHEHRN
jgi:predicted Zn-dependent protease